jgi:hypothetical protein
MQGLKNAFLTLALLFGAFLPAHAQLYTSALSAANEVPPAASTGTGTALVGVLSGQVAYNISVTGITSIQAAHIHRGAAGVNGPVVVNFNPTFNASGVARGAVAIPEVLAAEIEANPANFYVNVHTTAFPGGEVRGQLVLQPSQRLVSNLSGANEVPPVLPAATGTANVLVGGSMVAYLINTPGVTDQVAGHIHRGAAGVNGPVVVDFAPTFSGGVAAGVVSTTAATVTEILGGPTGFYVNVHTTTFPTGAVRGQLAVPLPAAALSGAPTLSQWALIALAGLLFGVTVLKTRRS